ncbi:MAG: hypothetical protein SGJ13_14930 [Actinomycetota bacterium]|nr:hypothetical protein [Actinomycetota bacterium]
MSKGDVVVDDHLLLRVLLGDEPPALRQHGGQLSTTGLWYHRLCRALADTTVVGTMSRSLGNIDDQAAARVIGAVTMLPDTIGLASLRTLAWPMAALIEAGARLNLMSLEALAAARHLDATICLAEADDNRPLVEVAGHHDVVVRVIA